MKARLMAAAELGEGEELPYARIPADEVVAAPTAETCLACHNEESPTFDPARYTLPDGSSAGFDFELAKERIPHPIPEHVKGRFIELEKEEKARARAAEGR